MKICLKIEMDSLLFCKVNNEATKSRILMLYRTKINNKVRFCIQSKEEEEEREWSKQLFTNALNAVQRERITEHSQP